MPFFRFSLALFRPGRELPRNADEFTLFLKSYASRWAGIMVVS